MEHIDRKEWSEVIEETLRLFDYEGEVTIEDSEEADEWLVSHPAFGCPFVGFYPKVEEIFTVLTAERAYKDPNGLDRKHKEGIVFDAITKYPLYYSINNGPEYQRIIIRDFSKHKKGEILYCNGNISGGYRVHSLVKPIFESEVFDVNTLITKLRYGT